MNDNKFFSRLVNERHELREKTIGLRASLSKENFVDTVGEVQFNLLKDQLKFMEGYLDILDKRIELLQDEYSPRTCCGCNG